MPFYRLLLGRVSQHALDLIKDEVERLKAIEDDLINLCGHLLTTSCGIPCACQLSMLLKSGRCIPFSSVDNYYKKLDFSPETDVQLHEDSEEEDDDTLLDREIDNLKEAAHKQSGPNKKSWIRKIRDLVRPKKSDIKPPKVLEQTRGRPKKKTGYVLPDLNKPPPFKVPQPLAKSRSMHTQITRHEEPNKDLSSESARHSAYIFKAQPPPIKDPFSQSARHNSYVPRSQTPPMDHWNQVPDSESGPCSSYDLSQWIIGTKSLRAIPSPPGQDEQNLSQWLFGQSLIQPSNKRPYINDIPEVFHPYITRDVDVNPDGNCGFRALAVAMGYEDTNANCEMVRKEMLTEYLSRKRFYDKYIFKKGEHVDRNISVSKFSRPPGYWMQTPDAGILLANRLGCIVVCLAPSGSTPIFPFEQSPEECEPHRTFSIASVWKQQHYVMVELSNDSPLPMITPFWARRSEAASRWEVIYQDRLQHYLRLTQKPAGYANLESSHSSFYY